jgi:hypothetical protein
MIAVGRDGPSEFVLRLLWDALFFLPWLSFRSFFHIDTRASEPVRHFGLVCSGEVPRIRELDTTGWFDGRTSSMSSGVSVPKNKGNTGLEVPRISSQNHRR